MFDLCYMDQGASLELQTTSLPEYDIAVKLAANQVRFAVWGVYVTFEADTEERYWPVRSRVFWQQKIQGFIYFWPRDNLPGLGEEDNVTVISTANIALPSLPNPAIEESQAGKIAFVAPGQGLNFSIVLDNSTGPSVSNKFTVPDGSTEASTSTLTISLAYSGATLRNRDVFKGALSAMALMAAWGPNTVLPGLRGPGSLQMISGLDQQGIPLLRCRHVIRVMRKMAEWMVNNRRFAEVDIVISKYGVEVATGHFFGAVPEDVALNIANSTFLSINQAIS
ncbi:hypothetical protein MMC28_001403 [Mycoblastus sanguinarius]|nr:hypothetical protein [Mycoblastus sanguinarius]